MKENIFVDCKYKETFKSVNTYVIGIGGTVVTETSGEISNYYLAKFSTKYNLTEYFVVSENYYVIERVVGVNIDFSNEMVYLAVEINRNKYHDSTVYSPNSKPSMDNSNIAIIGYSWTHAVRLWTTVVGNENYADLFS
jgi:hypothetical protein